MVDVSQNESQPASQLYDLVIVGSGSAAYSTAISAADSGRRIVMIERGEVGGTCVNIGCIPSKALLATSHVIKSAMSNRIGGVESHVDKIDIHTIVREKDNLVALLRKEKYEDVREYYGFDLMRGDASFISKDVVLVNGKEIQGRKIVIATGSLPQVPFIPGLESVDYLTSTTAMEIETVPETVLILGGGAIGLEFSQLYSALGSKVIVVEALDRIAFAEEPELSDALEKILREDGITVLTSTNLKAVSAVKNPNGETSILHVLEKNGEEFKITTQAILVATGRVPNTKKLNLEAAGVTVGLKGEILVDNELRTSNPDVFAAGDVTGHPQFVCVAGRHGSIIADNAFENEHREVDYRSLPRVTFTSPEIASVGMTDADAVKNGISCDCRVVSLNQLPRAIVNRDTRGVAKIVIDSETRKVLGIHLLADGASDAILAGVYAIEANFTVDDLANMWAPYLTTAEVIKLAAQSFTKDLAHLSCCAV